MSGVKITGYSDDLSAPPAWPQLEIYYAGEWAALYVDGRLDRVGDVYLAEERAFEILGVKTVHDDAYMRGQERADGVAQTLDEVEAYRQDREDRQRRAAELQEQARKLQQEAARLMEGS